MLILSLFFTYAFCWGRDGHKIIGELAYRRLAPATQQWVDAYLGTMTLADVAPLPDMYAHEAGGHWSEPLHFANVPTSAVSFQLEYCPSPPACVVKAITNFTKNLQNEGTAGPACQYGSGIAPCPLEFITHMVGDSHQPLHISYLCDLGGNDVKVTFYGDQTELHGVWDWGMISHFESHDSKIYDWKGYADYLQNTVMPTSPIAEYEAVTDPSVWANESYSYTLNTVYLFSANQSSPVHCEDLEQLIASGEEPALGDWYNYANMPTVNQRLIAASVRLATLLDSLFQGKEVRLVAPVAHAKVIARAQ